MASSQVVHPYFPKDLELPHYVPNNKTLVELLGVFFGLVAVCLVVIWVVMSGKRHLNGCPGTKLKICWFLACGFIHMILEGYFSVRHKTLAGEQTFLAQLWKEYGKGDSRYMTSDTFTVCMESITALVDGPLAFLATYAFLNRTPSRYVIQLLLSVCQLYGDVLYFSTEVKDGFSHGYMYHPLYFWFYFFFMNILWIIIPFVCIVESCVHLIRAQRALDSGTGGAKKKSK